MQTSHLWCLAAIAATVAISPAHAQARGVSVTHERCGDVTVVAVDAMLSEVVAALARELAFDYRFIGAADERVTLNRTGAPTQLVADIARHHNVIYSQRRDIDCGRSMPARLWVLGNGGAQAVVADAYTHAVAPTGLIVANPSGTVARPTERPARTLQRSSSRSDAEREQERATRRELRRENSRRRDR